MVEKLQFLALEEGVSDLTSVSLMSSAFSSKQFDRGDRSEILLLPQIRVSILGREPKGDKLEMDIVLRSRARS